MVSKSKIALRTSVSTMKQIYFTALFLNFHPYAHTQTHTLVVPETKEAKMQMEISFYGIKFKLMKSQM